MGTVHAIHGIVPECDDATFIHRNLLDQDDFAGYLQRRDTRFVDLSDAIAGRGDALTIDDSTRAAGDAARLARRLHHEVTLFVNPYNVAEECPYYFSVLNVVLDDTPRRSTHYKDVLYELSGNEGKQRLRAVIKRDLARLTNEPARQRLVEEVGKLLGVPKPRIPWFLRPLSASEVRELAEIGVRIESHNWTHADLDFLDAVQASREILQAHDWLAAHVKRPPTAIAPPFGISRRPSWLPCQLSCTWYLCDERLPCGRIDGGTWNRQCLDALALSREGPRTDRQE